MNEQWKMNRAGLVNFWYYDDETFDFADGKLLLRGANGSGKSVTMQSFLPVLLDGRKSPDRLDPFGSRARKMQDYLLGEKEVTGHEERTGYLFLEYVKESTSQYITTGIGMQAKRNKQMKSWYFILTDQRRIGQDFFLTQQIAGERIPFTEKELTNRVGTGGHVVTTQREYMEMVNRYIFGFESLEAYEDLINLLIQIRAPKLSKEFKPTVIYEILESALPPLTDEEIKHLSDSIDQMDQVQQQLTTLFEQTQSIDRLSNYYDTYIRYTLAERAEKWNESEIALSNSEKNLQEVLRKKELLDETIVEGEIELKKVEQAIELLEKQKEQLSKHEVWSLEKKKLDLIKQRQAKEEDFDRNETKLSKKQREYREKTVQVDQTLLVDHNLNRDMTDLIYQLNLDAEGGRFQGHQVNIEDYIRMHQEKFDFAVWLTSIKEYRNILQEAIKIVNQHNQTLVEYRLMEEKSSEQKQKVDHLQRQLEQNERWVQEETAKLETAIFSWMQDYPVLEFTNEQKQKVSRLLDELYETKRYEEVMEPLRNALTKYEVTLRTRQSEVESKQSIVSEQREKLLQSIYQLKNQRMIEPERYAGTIAYRENLKVVAYPFYELVDFQEHVSMSERARIEAALKQTGILDSLISADALVPQQDAVLNASPFLMVQTLADYLKPDIEEGYELAAAHIDDILRSIPLQSDGQSLSLDSDGSYTVGILKGDAPDMGEAKYIGRSSRKRYLQNQINQLTSEVQELEEMQSQLTLKWNEIEKEKENVLEWENSIPDDHSLFEVYKHYQELGQNKQTEQRVLDTIDSHWKEIQYKLDIIKPSMSRFANEHGLQMNETVLNEITEVMDQYSQDVNRLARLYWEWKSNQSTLSSLQATLEEIEEDIDYRRGELAELKEASDMLMREISGIEEQLMLTGVEEIRSEINKVQISLQENKLEQNRLQNQLPEERAERKQLMEKQTTLLKQVEFWSNYTNEWKRLVLKEMDQQSEHIGEEHTALNALKRFENLLTSLDKSKVQEQLTKSYYSESHLLSEYRLIDMTEETDTPVWMMDSQFEDFKVYIDLFSRLKNKRTIRLSYQGAQVSPSFLRDELTILYQEQKRHLDEQDRKLYEDIMLNTIGSILRRRIKRAHGWVKDMDKIMSERDNSSGLIFSIQWKPKTAESEDELDTKELVGLLERDSKYLHEEDLAKITKHFQSRIIRAKELISLRNEGSTLHQVLKEVLDYRKWFSFVLSFKRSNEPRKRELTNNAFFQFSGGEKAMAMYIPLFTAAYSRYKEASESAPYIISLDEAFAGVDEKNIRDMFEVVEQLGFNYIMNSQALWGDYDTVPALAIADLLRPKNADFVTVMRYRWNGSKRISLDLSDK
ncbi:uncharacterized protein (TIGR02680 family) [Chryseomicrobium aureum]|uniref:TIGR02680 family protein n=1 Tax=Chryseomicrobium aureum TaxID=1441723 RepID=UPI00195A255C|nr:TIGR02680 family protein [Chryseomicrobium aureum]MBM7706422.1 uncharacterized protein (TIGR02680 family) [Chryseomicrobium aureum]